MQARHKNISGTLFEGNLILDPSLAHLFGSERMPLRIFLDPGAISVPADALVKAYLLTREGLRVPFVFEQNGSAHFSCDWPRLRSIILQEGYLGPQRPPAITYLPFN